MAQLVHHEWKLDNVQMAGNDQVDSSVSGSIGTFGPLVLDSHEPAELTAVLFRVFKISTDHAVLMCSDQRKSSLWPKLYKPAFRGELCGHGCKSWEDISEGLLINSMIWKNLHHC
ncbi:fructan 1-exohydrolase-like [Phalaenopsis equestris]|uniref:fructan 1-exohydrolase-like n=1 Tax=Phalaenopsis equestris TaxID=78828 RepID=UPI0009E5AD40|nr:fructan 1-exohydrolase-like [Phalaenopsis equestris]XP_020597406.1 fructan 1-exohydrolase-like [Phalaenopsis equestris]